MPWCTVHAPGGSIRWWLAIGVAVIAVAVAATRVLLGVHWLSDVVAGLLVGWVWVVVVTLAFGGRWLKFGQSSTHPPDGEHEARSSNDALDDGESATESATARH